MEYIELFLERIENVHLPKSKGRVRKGLAFFVSSKIKNKGPLRSEPLMLPQRVLPLVVVFQFHPSVQHFNPSLMIPSRLSQIEFHSGLSCLTHNSVFRYIRDLFNSPKSEFLSLVISYQLSIYFFRMSLLTE